MSQRQGIAEADAVVSCVGVRLEKRTSNLAPFLETEGSLECFHESPRHLSTS